MTHKIQSSLNARFFIDGIAFPLKKILCNASSHGQGRVILFDEYR